MADTGKEYTLMSATSGSAPTPPFPQTREFWVLMAYALGLGVFGACAALLFMGLIGFGNNWYTVSDPGWFGGQWWWVGVTAAAGVVVGLLRRWTHLPARIPSLVERLRAGVCRPPIGAGDRGRLGRVVDRRSQLGPGAGARVHRRRGRRVGLPAASGSTKRTARSTPWPGSPAPTVACSPAR